MSCIPQLMVHVVNDYYSLNRVCIESFNGDFIKVQDIQKCKTAIAQLKGSLDILDIRLEKEVKEKI